MSKQPVTCSPDERSDIRVRSTSFNAAPGFRFAHPGYKLSLRLASGKQMKEAERRQTHTVMPVRKRRTGRATEKAACAALPLRARSPAGVPLTALAAATERHRSAPVHALPGTVLLRGGRYPPPAVPVQRALKTVSRDTCAGLLIAIHQLYQVARRAGAQKARPARRGV